MSSYTVAYTSISFDSDLPPWGFHLMDPAEFEAPPSLDYVPGLEHPPSPDYVHVKDQPLPVDASPAALSPGYVTDSDSEENPKEDPEEDPADRGEDNDDESSDDDNDDDDDDDDDDEFPQLRIQSHLRRTSLHPHHHHPDLAGLGYMSDPRHRCQLLLRHSLMRDDIPEVDMSLWKRAYFSTSASRFVVRESLAVAAARQAGHALTSSVDYRFIDTVDASIHASESRVMTVVGVRQRIRDEDRLTTHIQHEHDRFRELVCTAKAGPQDGPADAGSSC
ncbi:hypothetical protein Tco_1007524 [Tanacetum coccineum]